MKRLLLALTCSALLACPGPQGQPCSVRDNGDGTATISCPDGTSVLVRNGEDGPPGTSCTVSTNPDAGTKTITCTDGTSVTVIDGKDGTDANAVVDYSTLTAAELKVTEMTVTVVSITNAARPVVTFVVRDGKGRGVKRIPPANFSGISLLQLVPGDISLTGNGLNVDTWVSHIANCATCTASTETASATSLLDQQTGAYVYTFQKDVVNPGGGGAVAGVAFNANAPHKFGLRLAASGNPFRPVDAVYEYIPATGAEITGQNDKVNTGACLQCHMQWRANALNAGGTVPFHNGQRYEVQYCVVCHNDQRKYSGSSSSGNPVIAEPAIDASGNMTPPAGRTSVAVLRGEAVIDLPVFAHKIHMGHKLTLKGNYAGMGPEMNHITFPQSAANCATCHRNATLADNWKNKPSRRACGACHDKVDFVTGAGHLAGPMADDRQCGACHPATLIASAHVPVAPLDPNNIFSNPDGGSSNTNASALGSLVNPPPGAIVFTYAMPDSGVITVPTTDGGYNAQVRFKLTSAQGDVVFNTFDAGVPDMIDNFVGSPSAYCVYSVPQDGIAAPADFNASASGYLKNIWRGTATGSGAGTLAGPDTGGFYTVTLTGVTIPPSARMLTCGVGYSYNLSSTQPLTQTNVPGYPYTPATKVGGLAVPPSNIWQVAVGHTGRRGAANNRSPAGAGLIVNQAKCNNCHSTLGVGPSFHAGQRNDGASCSWCHTQNRASSGWSAGSESFVHAIHGAGKRTVPFNWHALAEEEGFYDVTFPGRPQQCEGCHNPGYYDFSASWYTDSNLAARLPQTVATGTYYGLPTLADGGVNTAAWSISPYVIADAGYNYGSGYSFNAATQVITEAAPTTLINSPITNACFGCHDSNLAVLHFRANGGQVYEPRGPQPYVNQEQCLLCHGPGKIAAIKDVHYQ